MLNVDAVFGEVTVRVDTAFSELVKLLKYSFHGTKMFGDWSDSNVNFVYTHGLVSCEHVMKQACCIGIPQIDGIRIPRINLARVINSGLAYIATAT